MDVMLVVHTTGDVRAGSTAQVRGGVLCVRLQCSLDGPDNH